MIELDRKTVAVFKAGSYVPRKDLSNNGDNSGLDLDL